MIDETMEITASYSRKLNHKVYGGQEYESSDHFCSAKIEVSDEEDPQKVYNDLHEQCQLGVMQSMRNEITGIAGGLQVKVFNAWLDNYLANKNVSADEYASMSTAQKEIIQAIKRSKKRQDYQKNQKDQKNQKK